MDFETSGRGLIPISEPALRRLRDARISLYSAHAPLDCHDAVSTSRSLARAAGVKVDDVCAGYHGGYAGVIGTINETILKAFLERLCAALNVDLVDVHSYAPTVKRIAVFARGAALSPVTPGEVASGGDA